MFTGLVQAMGSVSAVLRREQSLRLVARPERWDHRPSLGDSISVSGVCLTVAAPPLPGDRGALTFDVVSETLDKTTLGLLRVGSRVNLEHAATATTLMGGHIVQGHVDGRGRVAAVRTGEDWRVRVVPEEQSLMQYVVPKGCITVDGVSLTIASIFEERSERRGSSRAAERGFEVALIPTTLEKTTLSALRKGDHVNLEMDTLAKTVVHYLRSFGEQPLGRNVVPAPSERKARGASRRAHSVSAKSPARRSRKR
jgi:riboflavin synthase